MQLIVQIVLHVLMYCLLRLQIWPHSALEFSEAFWTFTSAQVEHLTYTLSTALLLQIVTLIHTDCCAFWQHNLSSCGFLFSHLMYFISSLSSLA